jgi:SAM-dependent methyltransferase
MKNDEFAAMAAVESRHWWYRALRSAVVANLERHLPPRTAVTLVDAGAGTGGSYDVIERAFSTNGRRVTYVGVDLSPEALSRAREKGLAHAVQASVDAMPIRSASADVVLCLDVLCYAGLRTAAVLADLARLTRPGGLFVLNEPAFAMLRGRHDEAVGIARRFRKTELSAQVAAAGFEIIRAGYWNVLLTPPMFFWRAASRLVWAGREPSSDLRTIPSAVNRGLGIVASLDRVLFPAPSRLAGSSVFVVSRRR